VCPLSHRTRDKLSKKEKAWVRRISFHSKNREMQGDWKGDAEPSWGRGDAKREENVSEGGYCGHGEGGGRKKKKNTNFYQA